MRSIRRQLLVWLLAGLSLAIARRSDRNVPACARRSECAVRLSAQGNGCVADRRALRGRTAGRIEHSTRPGYPGRADLGPQRRAVVHVATAPRAAAARAARLHDHLHGQRGMADLQHAVGRPGGAGRATDERAPRARREPRVAHHRAAAGDIALPRHSDLVHDRTRSVSARPGGGGRGRRSPTAARATGGDRTCRAKCSPWCTR